MFVIVVSHHVPSLACWNKNRIFRSLSTRLTILIWAGNSQGEVHLTPQPSKKQQLESWNKVFGILKQFSEARMQMMQGGEKAGFPALHSLWKTARKLFTDYRAIMALQKKPRRKHNWHIQFSVFYWCFCPFLPAASVKPIANGDVSINSVYPFLHKQQLWLQTRSQYRLRRSPGADGSRHQRHPWMPRPSQTGRKLTSKDEAHMLKTWENCNIRKGKWLKKNGKKMEKHSSTYSMKRRS